MYKDAIKEVAKDIKSNIKDGISIVNGEKRISNGKGNDNGNANGKAGKDGSNDSNARKKLVKVTAAVAVLASLAAGMLFSSVTDIMPELKQASINQPPIVMDIDEFGNATLDDDNDEDADEKKGNGGIVTRIKQAVLGLPVAVRLLIVTPLWAIGTAIMTVATVLGRAIAASPIGAFALTAVVGFGVLLGLFTLTAKVIFPDVPLNKILTKGHVMTLLVVALGLAGADAVAPLFWAKYPLVSGAVKLGVGAFVIAVLCNRVKRVSNKVRETLSLA